MKVTDKGTGENLKLYEWHLGDVALADAGYARAPQLKAVREKGVDFIVHYPSKAVRMLLETGEKLDMAAELKKHEDKSQVTLPVVIDSKDATQPAYLHAYRLPMKHDEKVGEMHQNDVARSPKPTLSI